MLALKAWTSAGGPQRQGYDSSETSLGQACLAAVII